MTGPACHRSDRVASHPSFPALDLGTGQNSHFPNRPYSGRTPDANPALRVAGISGLMRPRRNWPRRRRIGPCWFQAQSGAVYQPVTREWPIGRSGTFLSQNDMQPCPWLAGVLEASRISGQCYAGETSAS